jgi:squalene monooxygenase
MADVISRIRFTDAHRSLLSRAPGVVSAFDVAYTYPAHTHALICVCGVECVEEIDAATIYGYGVFLKGEALPLTYDVVSGTERERDSGRAFHHGRFVQRLRSAAAAEPLVTVVEGTVTALRESHNEVVGLEYRPKGAARDELVCVEAGLTVACDGHGSRFRRRVIPEKKPTYETHFVALELRDVDLPFPNHGHVFLINPCPVLLYPVRSSLVHSYMHTCICIYMCVLVISLSYHICCSWVQIATRDVRMLIDIPSPLPSASKGHLQAHIREKVIPQLPDVLHVRLSGDTSTHVLRE